MTKYAVSFPTLNSEDIREGAALVAISVGRDAHEGEQFRDTITAIKTVGFKKVYVMVACTLQAHTELISNAKLTEQEAKAIALRKGDEWVERNQAYIDQLGEIEHEIIRWDTWLMHPKFAEKAKVIEDLYTQDEEFHSSIDKAAAQFNGILAKKESVKFFDAKKAVELSAKYVKEESAVIVLWREIPDARYIIYPVRNSPAHACIFNCLQQVSNGKISEQKSLTFLDVEIKELKEDHRKNGRRGLTVVNNEQSPNALSKETGHTSHLSNSSSPSLSAFELYIDKIIGRKDLPLAEKEAYLTAGLKITLAASFAEKPADRSNASPSYG